MIDRRFLSTSLSVERVVSELPSSPTNKSQYLIQGAESGSLAQYNNHIARYRNNAWEFTPPRKDGLEVINLLTSETLYYDGSILW